MTKLQRLLGDYINITTNEQKKAINQIVKAMGTIGTLCFLAMPYAFGTDYFLPLAVSGNFLLLPQVIVAKQWNLVLLNIVGGGKYFFNWVF